LLLLLLLTPLLLLLLRQMVADDTAGRCAGNRMVTGNVPGNGAHRRTLQAPLGLGPTCGEQHGQARQTRNQHLLDERTHGHTPVI
jgi:hypothetical protein